MGMLQLQQGFVQSVIEVRLRAVCVTPEGRDTVTVCRYSALYGYLAGVWIGALN